MPKTLIYVVGVLALHFTNLSHAHGFYNLFLPVVGLLFLVFLVIQLMLFGPLNNFETGDGYRLFDLLTRQ